MDSPLEKNNSLSSPVIYSEPEENIGVMSSSINCAMNNGRNEDESVSHEDRVKKVKRNK